jgi:uncharacterized protein
MHDTLRDVLSKIERPIVAMSGGVDSVTLGAVCADIDEQTLMVHAVSPAVPAEATARVRRLAEQRGWRLSVIGAGEFEDPNYRANPVNRCYHCKTALYTAIQATTQGQILSGANLDDLGEYRPGLEAARQHQVRHPFIEASLSKAAVREIARRYGLDEVADLPASPCLSSRVETGIRIEAPLLGFVHSVERLLTAHLEPQTVRCRVRAAAVVIELDGMTLGSLRDGERGRIERLIRAIPGGPERAEVRFEPYRNGSAFLTEGSR